MCTCAKEMAVLLTHFFLATAQVSSPHICKCQSNHVLWDFQFLNALLVPL